MTNILFVDDHISVYQTLDGRTTMIRNTGRYTVKILEKLEGGLLPVTVLYGRTEAYMNLDVNIHRLFFEVLKPSD